MKVQFLCCFVLLMNLVGLALSKNERCPFDYMYHFGDGVTDVGNSVLILPSLPPAFPPYGMTFPGEPNGRWSDGLNDMDFAAPDFGFPKIEPYLSENSGSSNGVIFSVARSPVLDSSFFTARGIRIPPYAVSLSRQVEWFKAHLKLICSSTEDCAKILGNSLVLFGDLEANDIGYALTQGKSIEHVKTYLPFITRAHVKFIRELINMGATRIVIPGSAPIGCYPYMLTAMANNNSAAYDPLGCLTDVNNLITSKNRELEQSINDLSLEFPNITLAYGDYSDGFLQYFQQVYASDPDIALKACCGIGGKYNYDSERFCGSSGVPVCSNPDDYMFWDGLHLTHTTQLRMEQILIQGILQLLNCTSPLLSASM